jgi:YcxB-like protein
VDDLARQLAQQQAPAQALPTSEPSTLAHLEAPPIVPPTTTGSAVSPAAINPLTSEAPLAIIFTLTPEDLIAAEIYRVHHVPALRRQQVYGRLVWLALTVCLSGILLLLFFLSIHWLVLIAVGWVTILPLTVLLNDLLLKNYSIKKMIEKAVHAGKYRDMFVRQQVTVSSDGYTIVSPHVEVKHAWQVVKQIAVTETHIYLFTSESGANIIPKRAFANNEEADAFIRLTQHYHSAVHQQTSYE